MLWKSFQKKEHQSIISIQCIVYSWINPCDTTKDRPHGTWAFSAEPLRLFITRLKILPTQPYLQIRALLQDMFGGMDHKSLGTMIPFLVIQPDVPSRYKDHSGFRNMFFISTGLGNVTHRSPSDYKHLSALMTSNVSSAHPFVHTRKKMTTHKALFLEWYLRVSMDV